MVSTRAYEFGAFRLVVADKRLLRDGLAVPLAPKVFDTLLLLVEARGMLVGKDELIKALWPDTFVEEVTLAHNVSLLRKALRDGADGRYIETVPKRGYRFVHPVRELAVELDAARPVLVDSDATAPDVAPAAHPPAIDNATTRHLLPWAVAAVAVLAVAAYAVVSQRTVNGHASRAHDPVAIAILPFATAGLDSSTEYLGWALADALVVRLHRVRGVVVRPIASRFDARHGDAAAFARSMHADLVLVGSIQRSGTRMRVEARLTRVADSTVLWADEFDEDVGDTLAVETSIASRLVQSVAVSVSAQGRTLAQAAGTRVAAAHHAYLRGRYFWNQRSAEGLTAAISALETAVRLDPRYALAYAALADAYILANDFASKPNAYTDQCRAAAARALELDPSLAQPHATLGLIAMNVDWAWSNAEREYRTAIMLDPGYATAHAWYGEFMAQTGRFDDGIQELRRASELDPLSTAIRSDIAKALTLARRYDEALAELRSLEASSPGYWRIAGYRERALMFSGRYDEALAALAELRLPEDNPNRLAEIVQILGRAGRQRDARAALDRLIERSRRSYVHPVLLAVAYGAVGDLDNGFSVIDRMCEEHSYGVLGLNVDPTWDPYRRDARFRRVLERVGFGSD